MVLLLDSTKHFLSGGNFSGTMLSRHEDLERGSCLCCPYVEAARGPDRSDKFPGLGAQAQTEGGSESKCECVPCKP